MPDPRLLAAARGSHCYLLTSHFTMSVRRNPRGFQANVASFTPELARPAAWRDRVSHHLARPMGSGPGPGTMEVKAAQPPTPCGLTFVVPFIYRT